MAAPSSAARQRSCTAIVMTRADRLEGGAPASPGPAAGPPPRDRLWLWWLPLGLLVAGVWALLLLGDSLPPH
jgi:hypothetical protein